jgi:hypothetical protein
MSQSAKPASGHVHPKTTQSKSSNKATHAQGGKRPPAAKAPSTSLVFRNEGGQEALSTFSVDVLDGVRRDAGLHQITITSVYRTPKRQAEIMYKHEQERGKWKETMKADERRMVRDKAMIDPQDPRTMQQYRQDILKSARDRKNEPVNYLGDGGKVQAVANRGMAHGESREATINKMTAKIIGAMEKGHSVSTHLGQKPHLEVADISLRDLKPEQKTKLLNAIRNRFHGSVYRLGHPDGPRGGQGVEFNDHDCFHVEIMQLPDIDPNQA